MTVVTLDLQEGRPESFGSDSLSVQDAVNLERSGRFDIEWPSPRNDFRNVVTARGWIGHIPVTSDLMVRVTPKVPVSRLFDLLEVAYDLKSFRLLDGATDIETLEGLIGRLASILAKRVLDRARRGLYGGYEEASDQLPLVRGRIDPAATVRCFLRGGMHFRCTYENHTRDLEDNQILLWTMHEISRLPGLRTNVRQEVRAAYRAINGFATLTRCSPSDCVSRLYNRLNADYQPMHGLCRLLLEHMGPGVKGGKHDFIPFMFFMPSLFETFIARWLTASLPGDITVHTQYRAKLNASAALEVRIDIVLRDTRTGMNIAVLDTKYKDVGEPGMSDIQQVAFYANEMGVRQAFLVYPSTETKPLWVRNGEVTIQTLAFDLGVTLEQAGPAFLRELRQKLLPEAGTVRTAH